MTIALTFSEILTALSLLGGGLIALCAFMWNLIRTVTAGHERWIAIETFIKGTEDDRILNKNLLEKFEGRLEIQNDRLSQLETQTHQRWITIENFMKEIVSDRMTNKDLFEKFEDRLERQNDRLSQLETQTITRIEILETLKRTEQFFTQIVMQLQFLSKTPIKVESPDLQSPILKRQTQMDDRSQNRRANDK